MDTSHGNDESNIRFARSLNGEMKRFSPRRTLAHMSSVAAAGVYTSLRVTLGAGAGHNWWCVIFPPLCAQAAGLSEQAVQALSDDDVRLVTESDGGYVVRFRLLELWDALVQRLS